jgi:hypothetical protein
LRFNLEEIGVLILEKLSGMQLLSATMALAPVGSMSMTEKLALGDDDEDAGSGLFLNFS